MRKDKTFAFRIDLQTLRLLQMLEEKTGNAKSVIIRELIRLAAEGVGPPNSSSRTAGIEKAGN